MAMKTPRKIKEGTVAILAGLENFGKTQGYRGCADINTFAAEYLEREPAAGTERALPR
jgi:hypothetical protein